MTYLAFVAPGLTLLTTDLNLTSGDGIGEGMKHSPHNGPGTPRDDLPPVSAAGDMAGYNMPFQDNVNVSILYSYFNMML